MTAKKLCKQIENWQQENSENRCAINIIADKKENVVNVTFVGYEHIISVALLGALVENEDFRKAMKEGLKLAEKIIERKNNEN